jgi:hypothetical protein
VNFDKEVFPEPAPKPPGASTEALTWARSAGHTAGLLGRPPIPPATFAVCAKAWGEGWLAGAGERKPNGWASVETDYNWKDRL